MARPLRTIVYVGRKATMNYVLACITLFHGGAKEILIKARGRSISKAVDVARIVRENFMRGVVVKNVEIGTEIMTRKDGRTVSVSTISILLVKEGEA